MCSLDDVMRGVLYSYRFTSGMRCYWCLVIKSFWYLFPFDDSSININYYLPEIQFWSRDENDNKNLWKYRDDFLMIFWERKSFLKILFARHSDI